MEKNLEQLAVKAQNGDTEAFGALYDATFDLIYNYFHFRVKNPEDAQDLTSQIYLEAWQHIKRFNPDRSFSAWLFGFAKFRLIDFYRRQKPQATLEAVTNISDGTDIESETATRLENTKMVAAVNRLPEPYRTVIQLKYLQELEYSEIAQILGKQENNLRVMVSRGIEKLRQIL